MFKVGDRARTKRDLADIVGGVSGIVTELAPCMPFPVGFTTDDGFLMVLDHEELERLDV